MMQNLSLHLQRELRSDHAGEMKLVIGSLALGGLADGGFARLVWQACCLRHDRCRRDFCGPPLPAADRSHPRLGWARGFVAAAVVLARRV